MAEKKENPVSPAQTAKAKEEIIKITETKQQQSFLNLDSNEDEKVTLVLTRYTVNDKAPVADQLKAAAALVTPESEKVKAFIKYAESKAYQDAKNAALAKGNYLTQQVKSTIVAILSNYPAMAELSAKDVFERWLTGFKAGKTSAKNILDQAKAAQTETIDL